MAVPWAHRLPSPSNCLPCLQCLRRWGCSTTSADSALAPPEGNAGYYSVAPTELQGGTNPACHPRHCFWLKKVKEVPRQHPALQDRSEARGRKKISALDRGAQVSVQHAAVLPRAMFSRRKARIRSVKSRTITLVMDHSRRPN
ncbi:hypothetical protein NDU88_006005 [Pleurodeles waltl]|uniref:Uncharacterized protein n=1 Tax=Pleurodeles waltl TaxID=8319 RepID=A0AAV7TY80_PLEWA|nr:hypothetical protein NDU88_006005 [Pleurodeles waltl]